MNNNYYQSEIKISKQEDGIYAMRYASQQILIDKLKKQLEAYENMRKEAIEWINKHKEKLHHNFDEPDWEYLLYGSADELSNILNKVGGSDE